MKTKPPVLYSQPLIEDIKKCSTHNELMQLEDTEVINLGGNSFLERLHFKWTEYTQELLGAVDTSDYQDVRYFMKKLQALLHTFVNSHLEHFLENSLIDIETDHRLTVAPAMSISPTHLTVSLIFRPMNDVEWKMRQTVFQEKKRKSEEEPSLADLMDILNRMGGSQMGEA